MAVVLLFGLVLAVVVVALALLLLGVWSPYWVASGWVRRRDRRTGAAPPRSGIPVDRRAERQHAVDRTRAWIRNVNDRF